MSERHKDRAKELDGNKEVRLQVRLTARELTDLDRALSVLGSPARTRSRFVRIAIATAVEQALATTAGGETLAYDGGENNKTS